MTDNSVELQLDKQIAASTYPSCDLSPEQLPASICRHCTLTVLVIMCKLSCESCNLFIVSRL